MTDIDTIINERIHAIVDAKLKGAISDFDFSEYMPSAADLAGELDTYDIACNVESSEVAGYIDIDASDVAAEIDMQGEIDSAVEDATINIAHDISQLQKAVKALQEASVSRETQEPAEEPQEAAQSAQVTNLVAEVEQLRGQLDRAYADRDAHITRNRDQTAMMLDVAKRLRELMDGWHDTTPAAVGRRNVIHQAIADLLA